MRDTNWIYVKPGAYRALLLGAAVLAAAGCGSITDHLPRFVTPYRPDVQQGNVITSDMVEQLRTGMTPDQVKFMLGTPLLTDAFHPDRWDYLYYLNPRAGARQRRNLVIYFKDNRLDHFTSDPMPPESMADNLILGRKPSAKPKAQPNKATSAPPAESTRTAPAEPPSTAPAEPAGSASVGPTSVSPGEPAGGTPMGPASTAPAEPASSAPVGPASTPGEPAGNAPAEPAPTPAK